MALLNMNCSFRILSAFHFRKLFVIEASQRQKLFEVIDCCDYINNRLMLRNVMSSNLSHSQLVILIISFKNS